MARDHVYASNPGLPWDTIELAQGEPVRHGDFYESPPAERPVNVPADYVLPMVVQWRDDDFYFVGWAYIQQRRRGATAHRAREGHRTVKQSVKFV